MKFKLLVASSILAISASIQAMPTKPEKCPDAATIGSIGNSMEIAAQDSKGQWAVVASKNNFETKNSWSFVIGQINAENEKDALEKARASLTSMQLETGPLPIQQIRRWGCRYSNSANYIAIAVTPDLEGGNIKSISQLFD